MVNSKQNQAGMNAANSAGNMALREGEWDPNDAISQKLKAFYTMTEQEAIPDRFLDLLEQLDEAERASKQQGNG